MGYAVLVLSLGCWAQTSGSLQQQPNRMNQPPAREDTAATKNEVLPTSVLHLTPVETIQVKNELAAGFADFTCDEDGNVYLGAETWAGSIRKLNPKGDLLTTFDRYSNPDIEVYGAGSYALTPDGDLYTWVGNKKDRYFYVIVFGPDGKYKSKIKIDPGFPWIPGPFAVFRNGNLLMTGQEYDRDVRQTMLPFTALFRSDGKLLKEVWLEDDERIYNQARGGDPKLTSISVPANNRAVSWGRVQTGNDGNIYIMRWLSPAVFYVVSPSGEVVRRFTVDPGRSGLLPVTMHISANRIAVLFREEGTREQQMKIVDLNGEEVATYDATSPEPKKPLGAAFACYSAKSGRFNFLATDDERRILFRILEPR